MSGTVTPERELSSQQPSANPSLIANSPAVSFSRNNWFSQYQDDKIENELTDAADLVDPNTYHSPSVRTVWVKCVFLKIGTINTVAETFNATCYVQAKWREESLDHTSLAGHDSKFYLDPLTSLWREKNDDVKSQSECTIQFEKIWDPYLDIGNLVGEAKQLECWRDLVYTADGECFVVEKRRVKGTFTEPMELKEFPFDIQDLSLLITSERKMNSIALLEDLEDLSNVVIQTFWDSEWTLKSFVHCEPRTTDALDERTSIMKPGLYFRCCVIRNPGFYVWNIMLIIFLVTSLSFTTFCVERKLPENRIQLSFILLLAGGTFKFFAARNIPHISYLTLLDRYILSLMGFLFWVAVYHGWISLLNDWDEAYAIKADFWGMFVFGSAYFLLHVIFLLTVNIRGRKKRKVLRRREQAYMEHVKESKIVAKEHMVVERQHKMEKTRKGFLRLAFFYVKGKEKRVSTTID